MNGNLHCNEWQYLHNKSVATLSLTFSFDYSEMVSDMVGIL